MLRGLFGTGTVTSMLRGGLEEAMATHKAIAARVSNAMQASTSSDFSSALQAENAKQKLSQADLERDMASLADTQLRYEADTKLLRSAYDRLRSAMKDRG